MVVVKRGCSLMGASEEEALFQIANYEGYDIERYKPEMPQHLIYLDTFAISVFPVTNTEYSVAIKAGVVPSPPMWSHKKWSKPDAPVVGVSWFDASRYCEWKGFSLPSEAQWEKAAGWNPLLGKKYVYPWGDEWDTNKCLNAESILKLPIMGKNDWKNKFWDSGIALKHGQTEAVGLRNGDNSYYGARMMSGHVWEWVEDNYENNIYSKKQKSSYSNIIIKNQYSDFRVLKGGSWVDDRNSCRVSYRTFSRESAWRYGVTDVGFRCVKNDI
jgi:formylglycine-generating enzyme required for sulfatase activity